MDVKSELSVHEFAWIVNRTVPAIRNLIFNGNMIAKLPATRKGKQLLINREQLFIFPFVQPGFHKVPKVLHYTEGKGLVECPECSVGLRCSRLDEDGHWNGKQ